MEWTLGVLGRPRSWTWWPSCVPTTQHILWLWDSDSFALVISIQWHPKYKVTNTFPFLSLSEEYEQLCKADLWDKDTVDVFWPGPCILRDYFVQDTICPLHYGLYIVLYSFKLQHLLLLLFVDLWTFHYLLMFCALFHALHRVISKVPWSLLSSSWLPCVCSVNISVK